MKQKLTLLVAALSFSLPSFSFDFETPEQLIKAHGTLVHSDTFDNKLDNWVVEMSEVSRTEIKNGALDIDDGNGTTVWFKHDIDTPSVIEFDGMVVVNGGPNDRGTDLNWFWMAQDPHSNSFFEKSEWRAGNMRKYDPMRLYYIGYGANDNSTTRFRRYAGDGKRPLLPEYDVSAKEFMNVPNVYTNIKIINLDDRIYVYANDKQLYEITDETQFKSGKFGFRTWKSHLKIDNFKVYTLN
ncbi:MULTISPECIES: DUF6250 domain-containing protein [unclassified Vibrio]|uniref:DUF6250 domain-containing protein n=1 Tax=unclassified Vibrio TaxID=2614977 RepID=UPI001482748C|nr:MULTISPECIES: DUF6250 domain-containing protein [unclassified Vibrio]